MAEDKPEENDRDYITNADGQRLFVRSWVPSGDPDGVVFIVHGVGEHSGRYEHSGLGPYLMERQYAVYSHDHVGHGKSEGDRVHIETFQIYVRDVIQHIEILKAKYGNILFFLFGHSMGGTVSALIAIQQPELLKGIVFSSPSIRPPVGFILRGVTRVIAAVAPQLQIRQVDPNTISRIPEEVQAYIDDPLVWHGGLKARWSASLFDAQDEIQSGVSSITLPFITIHGTGDTLVDIESSRFLYNRAQSEDKTFERFQGGFHELVNDLERDRFKQLVLDWLNRQTSG